MLFRKDETCFRPLLCNIKAELGWGQPGLMRWIWDETLPQSSIDRSTFYSAAHCATKWASGAAPLCCLMTPGLRLSVRTFGIMYDHTFLSLHITRSEIRPHIKWAANLVIAYGHAYQELLFCVKQEEIQDKGLNKCYYMILNVADLFSIQGFCDYLWVKIHKAI